MSSFFLRWLSWLSVLHYWHGFESRTIHKVGGKINPICAVCNVNMETSARVGKVAKYFLLSAIV